MNAKDIPYIDEMAGKAMQAIVTGIHSDPNMFKMMDELAGEKKQSMIDEISERAYLQAIAMYRRKQKVLTEFDK